MNFMSIMAIHKMENPHLIEWIEYHRLIGVNYFYLADNNDDPAPANRVLEPYIKAGIVFPFHIPGRYKQLVAYNHMLPKVGSLYVAAIDIDEFIFPIAFDNLRDLMKHYPRSQGLGLSWINYGSSGRETRPEITIRDLQWRMPIVRGARLEVKSIVKTAAARAYHLSHRPRLKYGVIVGEDRHPIIGPYRPFSCDIARVNHYSIRSKENLAERRARGGSTNHVVIDQAWVDRADTNVEHDDAIWKKYGNRLTLALQS